MDSRLRITILLLLASTVSSAGIVTQSWNDFSGVQGSPADWYYGRFVQSAFSSLDYFDSLSSSWTTYAGTPIIGAYSAFPGTTADDWAVRRWVSSVNGPIRVSGHLGIEQGQSNGDGVVAFVYRNGAQLQQYSLAAGDTTGFDYTFDTGVGTGDVLDFVITPGAGNNNTGDYTRFTSQIETTPTPEPQAVFLIGSALLVGFIARRFRHSFLA